MEAAGVAAAAPAGGGASARRPRPIVLDEDADDATAFHPGTVVRLAKLKAAPELNGTLVHILQWRKDKGRWEVILHPTQEKKAVLRVNLKPVSLLVEVDTLRDRLASEGKIASVVRTVFARLDELTMTPEVAANTRIGKVVNDLGKTFQEDDILDLSRRMVFRWRDQFRQAQNAEIAARALAPPSPPTPVPGVWLRAGQVVPKGPPTPAPVPAALELPVRGGSSGLSRPAVRIFSKTGASGILRPAVRIFSKMKFQQGGGGLRNGEPTPSPDVRPSAALPHAAGSRGEGDRNRVKRARVSYQAAALEQPAAPPAVVPQPAVVVAAPQLAAAQKPPVAALGAEDARGRRDCSRSRSTRRRGERGGVTACPQEPISEVVKTGAEVLPPHLPQWAHDPSQVPQAFQEVEVLDVEMPGQEATEKPAPQRPTADRPESGPGSEFLAGLEPAYAEMIKSDPVLAEYLLKHKSVLLNMTPDTVGFCTRNVKKNSKTEQSMKGTGTSRSAIRISNLPSHTTEPDLENLLHKHGLGPEEVSIAKESRYRRSSGIAFVTFRSQEAAEAAIGSLCSATISGHRLQAEWAGTDPQKPGEGGKRLSWKCGDDLFHIGFFDKSESVQSFAEHIQNHTEPAVDSSSPEVEQGDKAERFRRATAREHAQEAMLVREAMAQ